MARPTQAVSAWGNNRRDRTGDTHVSAVFRTSRCKADELIVTIAQLAQTLPRAVT